MTSLDPELLLAHCDWLRRLARQLAGDPHLADDDARGGYALVWAGTPPAPRYVYRFEPGPDGVHRAATLPAGRAQLRRRDRSRGTPDGWPLVAEVEVVAREHRVVTGK